MFQDDVKLMSVTDLEAYKLVSRLLGQGNLYIVK